MCPQISTETKDDTRLLFTQYINKIAEDAIGKHATWEVAVSIFSDGA
jgi:hypothetical protein